MQVRLKRDKDLDKNCTSTSSSRPVTVCILSSNIFLIVLFKCDHHKSVKLGFFLEGQILHENKM